MCAISVQILPLPTPVRPEFVQRKQKSSINNNDLLQCKNIRANTDITKTGFGFRGSMTIHGI